MVITGKARLNIRNARARLIRKDMIEDNEAEFVALPEMLIAQLALEARLQAVEREKDIGPLPVKPFRMN